MVSESAVLLFFSLRLWLMSFCGGPGPTLQGEAQAVIVGYWSQGPREPLRNRQSLTDRVQPLPLCSPPRETQFIRRWSVCLTQTPSAH